ncbi:glycosyltransferase family 4 protein [Rariglobus hedericola]|uniref:Glycosyltransferase family 4 protein n=1 Tax=Rariglobus hedericola TaxID=2597822 RepID=A0A556QJ73_9BACT|nr:glycosyltransferase family 4 protein [Rariglobus hedericola]TSJ76661.1 glycosyltransferase family 4 protein [Rariglobus hedericola]
MNILFINYGDRLSNSLNHIAAFVTELNRLGHACIIALPSREPGPAEGTLTYDEVVARPACFPNGRTADIIHAWTPREPVRRCLLAYQRTVFRPARVIIHLEDNERHILSTFTGLTFDELVSMPDETLGGLSIEVLSHPRRHQRLLQAADAVTCITPRLIEFVPSGIPATILPPGLDAWVRDPLPPDAALRAQLGLLPHEQVIVYPGSANHANVEEILTLYAAVALLNHEGIPTRLIRTGPNPPWFNERLSPEERRHVIELGFVDRARLPALFALASVLVQPGVPGAFNDYRLPSKLPEFLASGRPVILPDTNIAADMQDGREAVFLRTGSAAEIAARCREIFSNPDHAARLGNAGRAFALQHFDLATNTRTLVGVYEAALRAKPAVNWRRLWIPWWDENNLTRRPIK